MSDLGNKKIMAKNIQYYMDKNGKTRNDMCKALGVKYTTFTDWVKGNSYPRIDKIEMMANYFGIEKSDLIEDHSKPEYSSSAPARLPVDSLRDRVFDKAPALFYAVDKMDEQQVKRAEDYVFKMLMENDDESD